MNRDMMRRQGRGQGRAGTGREAAVWALGVLCGLGVAAAGDSLLLPAGLVLAVGGAAPLLWMALRMALRPRPRVVVWQEASWHLP